MSDLRKRIADLSPEKRALLVERLKGKQSAGPLIGKRPDPQTYPLSFAQQRMWFLHQMEPDSPLYNIPAAVRLTGDLDVPALQRSLQEIVRRHETLRATFVAKMGHVMQSIQGEAELSLPVEDLRDLPQAEREDAWQRLALEDARQPFDLTRDLLLRVRLLRLGEREYVVLLTMYHIASDGWSVGVLVRELAALYAAYAAGSSAPLPEPLIQYADFAHWQREWLQGDVLAQQLDYWRKQLAGAPPMLELPTDWPRPAVLTYNGAHYTFPIPSSLSDGLQALSRQQGATLFMTLLAAYQAMLYRYTRQEDVCVGTPVANRNRAEIEGLIGCFVNTLVMRSNLGDDPTFRQLLARVRETALEAYAHQDVPFEMLVDELRPERTLSYTPLFQAVFALEESPMDHLPLPGMRLQLLEVETGTAKFDLTLFVEQGADGVLKGIFEYNTDLFEAATVERMARHFVRLLEGIVADPDQQVSRLSLLAEAERRQLLDEWASVTVPYPRDATIHDLFAEQAARTPDAVALMFEDDEYTYAELNRRANQLAHRLQALGVGPDVLVGLIMERSAEMVVAHLAILKAGGAYLPLGADLPQERLAFTLRDGGASILLTQQHLAKQLPAFPGTVICLDKDWRRFAGESAENPRSEATAENLAYVMYTSGSTGRPKGVGVLHRGVVSLVQGANYARLGPDVVFPQMAPISFDAATLEIWGSLLNGGRLAVLPPHQLSLAEIGEGLRRYGVTHAWITTSLFQLLVDERLEDLKTLRHILTGGDVASPAHFQRAFEGLEGVSLTNAYGPTENTTFSTFYPVTDWGEIRRSVPIGRPIANSSIYVLDEHLSPVPIGVPGEVYVGGDGLARGYLNRPELTAERFVANPFVREARARLYRTGDLGRYLPDGNIEFLGRVDDQVKVRGFRIEPAEVQVVLGQHPAVRDVVVVAREDTPGEKRLVAYLLPDEEAPDISDLRSFMRERLPEYMVPSAFVFLDAFPMTSSGKVDRQALPAPEWSRDNLRQDYVAPRTPLEQFLAEKWQELLGIERVGVHDNFFELGGDSLQAAMLINKVQEELGVNTHVRTIFMAPTIAEMAPYMIEYYPDAVARVGQVASDTVLQQALEQDIADEGASGLAGGSPIVDTDSIAHIRRLVKALPPRESQAVAVVAEDKNPPAIFVLSPPRSGSTLLRTMLAGHAGLFAPPEMDLLSFNTLDERRTAFSGDNSFWLQGVIRAVMEARDVEVEEAQRLMEAYEAQKLSTHEFYRLLQEWIAPRVLVDKTPVYALDAEILHRMESDFRDARYIHLVRHPYGTIYSFIEAKLDQVFFRYAHPFSRRTLAELVWIISHQNILAFLQNVPAERQHQMSFEQLVRDPEGSMRDLCRFLGVEFHSCLVQPYDGQRMTDGIQPGVQMVGDFKFYLRDKIDPEVADRWQRFHTTDFLSDIGWGLAESLGYQRSTVAQAAPDTAPEAQHAANNPLGRLRPVSRERQLLGELPLSFAQQRLWFLDQFEPGNSFYNIPSAVRMTGALDAQALEQSINEIIRRHEVLRTTFSAVDGRAVQAIAPSLTITVPVTDLRDLPEAARPDGGRDAQMQRIAREEARRPFDLNHGPLLRVRLLRLEEQEHVLLLSMHHIVSDGWSTGVLIRELAALYRAFAGSKPSPLPSLPIQYADYAYWQREWLQGETLQAELAYWKERLSGCPAHLELPTDRPRPAVQTLRGATHWFELSGALARKVERLAREERASLFMTLLAAFQTLLYRYTGQEDICVGTPVANRNRPEIEPLIGFFVNTLVLRGDLSGNPTFRELLQRVRETALGAYAHQDVPFEMLVDELNVARDLSHTPLFQVMFTVQDAPMESLRIPGLTLSPLQPDSGAAKFDLTLAVVKKRKTLRVSLEYNTDLFDQATIERMAGHLLALVEEIVANPDAPIATLPLLTEVERRQLLDEWVGERVSYPREATVHELFAEQAARTPEAVAVVFENESLTYGELNRRANQLAHYLRKRGVGPEVLVGLCVERSLEMIVGIMGVLKADGAYLPLDPSYPADRIAYMLEDAGTAVLLTQERLLDRLTSFEGETLCLDRDWPEVARQPDENPEIRATADNLVYVIYTSGSTGRPKGAQLVHRGLVNLTWYLTERYKIERSSRILQFASLSFDVSAHEIVPALLHGARLYLARRETLVSAPELLHLLREAEISIASIPPSLLAVLEEGDLPALQTLMSAGEACPVEVARRWSAGRCFLNGYGPTETTVIASYYQAESVPEGATSISIGKAVANSWLYVLDGQGQLVPVGVPGELYIGGIAVGRGYLDRPDLTAERFVPDPFSGEAGARLYRTGDRVRYLPDGNIDFLGRMDYQVKVRGYRIELGEIEAVLRDQVGVKGAVVLAREDGSGQKRLVAYVVPEGEAPSIGKLREGLGSKLPEYMVPTTYVFLAAFPLTGSAKVDRKALPAPEAARPDLESDYVAPRTPEEQVMAGIWARVLGVERVGVQDNFFELGGDSILSIQVVARANQAGLRISPRQVFRYPTVAALVAVAGKGPEVQAEQGLVTGAVPLTPIQRHFLAQNLPNPHHWNQAVLLEVHEALDPELLRQTVEHLLAHHDALRLRLHLTPDGWQQTYADLDGRAPFSYVDLSSLPEGEQRAAVEREAARLQGSLHLTEGPLLRVAYMHLGGGQPGRLLLVAHHLVIDGVSWRVLFEDLTTVYRQLQQGQAVTLPPKTTSFRQWASRLEEYARRDAVREQLGYWQSLGAGVYPLPVDWPEGANTEASAEWVRSGLTEEETAALLRDVPAAYGTEINDVLLTALARAFREWTGAPSLLVDLEGHGRESLFEDVDLSRTVGWFTALYPVRLDLGMIEHPGEALKAVKEQLRGIPQRGLGYGLLRHLGDRQAAAALQALPQAQVSFNYLGQFEFGLNGALLAPARESAGPERAPQAPRAYLLDISGSVRGGRLQLDWMYSGNQYRRETIESLAEGYLRALREIIAHCQAPEAVGYTVSDFPEASLNQEELDEVLLELKEVSGDE